MTDVAAPRVAVVTLGCARNEVDSDEIGGRLSAAGWEVVGERPDVIVVNTCGFVASAKKDSIDTILDLADAGVPVVAAGCLAERYGTELASELPEAAAVLSFDDYPDIADRLTRVIAGESLPAHVPADRRRLLPVTPVERSDAAAPGHGGLARTVVRGATVPVKLASGCDRRCSFCAIPSFRGAFVSRRPTDVVDEVRAVAAAGAGEVLLVSENSTSYGKDLGDLRLLESLLPAVADFGARIRVTYLQPAEMRPGLVQVIASTPGLAPYFDLSFQHASGPVLRRMRRFGDAADFLGLIDAIRARDPWAGIRSNVIVGFPGETDDDLAVLEDFLIRARLDAVGVFGYSDEDGTEAVGLPDHVPDDVIAERVERVTALVDDLMAERAAERIGSEVHVLVESIEGDAAEGRAAHQGPEDGRTRLEGPGLAVGDWVRGRVVSSDGADIVAVSV
jgi:ribosomal protein S12 methylthiotransferase RimO